ncbi:hypothetical protein EDC04DRAFT_2605843 [Pisolithus marmoratus]|nr:hypothetical protein EDC04DRAFT_2605843 [Pisolithus marmoratus]
MLHWHSGHKILITLSTLQQADPDNPGDKGKSRAQEHKVPGSDGDIDEGSDLIQVFVSMDKVLIIPPSTLQFSREKGYDVTIGNHVRVACGPAVGIKGLVHSVDFVSGHLTVLADDGPLMFIVEMPFPYFSGQTWPVRYLAVKAGQFCPALSRKGYRGMLQSVGRTYCNVMIKSGIMQLKNTAVITDTTPPMSQLTVDPSAKPGLSTLACNPWVPHSEDITPQPLNELAKADADYGLSCLTTVVHCSIPDCFSMVKHELGLAPPGHVSVTVTSSTYCLILHGKLTGQIHWVKKCQVKKDPKGVELEDGTKLPLGDVCQGPNAIQVLPEIWLCSKDNACDPLTLPQCCSKAIISIYTIA